MQIRVNKDDIKQMTKKFNDIEKKQVPYATMLTLNKLAFETREESHRQILGGLNWKKNIPLLIGYTKATKKKLVSEVYINKRKWGFKVLAHHFRGGERSHKGLERFLKENAFIKENDYLIPPNNAKNTKGVSRMIINDFQKGLFSRFFVVTNSKNGKNGVYAKAEALNVGHLHTGDKYNIKWDTRKVLMLFKIVRKPIYKKRFDLKSIVHKVYSQKGAIFFNEAIQQALKTAKKSE